jgi:hypothetical protein
MRASALVFCCLLATTAAADEEAKTDALAAAEAWLAFIDAGQYAQAWARAATLLKSAVSEEDFGRAVSAVREPLGAVKERSLASATFTTTLPGAPDGEYVVIQYGTSFENKQSAIETVTPMVDRDGTWRVSGYYIR